MSEQKEKKKEKVVTQPPPRRDGEGQGAGRTHQSAAEPGAWNFMGEEQDQSCSFNQTNFQPAPSARTRSPLSAGSGHGCEARLGGLGVGGGGGMNCEEPQSQEGNLHASSAASDCPTPRLSTSPLAGLRPGVWKDIDRLLWLVAPAWLSTQLTPFEYSCQIFISGSDLWPPSPHCQTHNVQSGRLKRGGLRDDPVISFLLVRQRCVCGGVGGGGGGRSTRGTRNFGGGVQGL